MQILITIKYNSPAGNVTQNGYFQLKGKLPEQIALQWWKDIQRNVFAHDLISVKCEDEDITEKVKALLG